MPGSLQTEPAWLNRPVWLIGLFKAQQYEQHFHKTFCATMLRCKLRLFLAHINTFLHNKFVASTFCNMKICYAQRW